MAVVTHFTCRWEEADASDASFKLDKRLAILKMLLSHGGLSLYSLNAPRDAMNGVTPLGVAAWLNLPEVIRLLLEECPGVVSVDGVDTRGATPLMCKSLVVLTNFYSAKQGGHATIHAARRDPRWQHPSNTRLGRHRFVPRI